MSRFKFDLSERVRRAADAGAWRMGGGGIVVARGLVEHISLGSRNEYMVTWSDGGRNWCAEAELAKVKDQEDEEWKTTGAVVPVQG